MAPKRAEHFRALPLRLFRRQGNLTILLIDRTTVNPFRPDVQHRSRYRSRRGVWESSWNGYGGLSRRQVALGPTNIEKEMATVNLNGRNRQITARDRVDRTAAP